MIKHYVFMGHLATADLQGHLDRSLPVLQGWENITDVRLLEDRAFSDFRPAYELCRSIASKTAAVAAHINLNGQNITIMAIQ